MTDPRNDLLLATLQRADKAMDSDELLDQATQLALDNFWTPDHLTGLNRRGIAKRCRDMVDAGLLKQAGTVVDSQSRRATPTYVPANENDVINVPEPPELATSSESAPRPTRDQVLGVIDAQTEIVQLMRRQHRTRLAAMLDHDKELDDLTEKWRARLVSLGMEAL